MDFVTGEGPCFTNRRFLDVKYIVGDDWTYNLTSTKDHLAQPFWYEQIFIYIIVALEILSSHISLESSRTRGF